MFGPPEASVETVRELNSVTSQTRIRAKSTNRSHLYLQTSPYLAQNCMTSEEGGCDPRDVKTWLKNGLLHCISSIFYLFIFLLKRVTEMSLQGLWGAQKQCCRKWRQKREVRWIQTQWPTHNVWLNTHKYSRNWASVLFLGKLFSFSFATFQSSQLPDRKTLIGELYFLHQTDPAESDGAISKPTVSGAVESPKSSSAPLGSQILLLSASLKIMVSSKTHSSALTPTSCRSPFRTKPFFFVVHESASQYIAEIDEIFWNMWVLDKKGIAWLLSEDRN